MSTTGGPGACAVCAATTSSRCSACGVKFFCSREHQKLLWPTHKWLCDKEPSTFVFPPLAATELAAVERIYAKYKAGKPDEAARVLFEGLEGAGLTDPLTFIKGLEFSPNPGIGEPLRSLTLFEVYLLLAVPYQSPPRSPSNLVSPWITCATFLEQVGSRISPPLAPARHATLLFRDLAPVAYAMLDFAVLFNTPHPVGEYISPTFRRVEAAVKDVQVEDCEKRAVKEAVELWKQVARAFCTLPQHGGTLRFDV